MKALREFIAERAECMHIDPTKHVSEWQVGWDDASPQDATHQHLLDRAEALTARIETRIAKRPPLNLKTADTRPFGQTQPDQNTARRMKVPRAGLIDAMLRDVGDAIV
ncbi:MAG: hypothetical protein ACRCV9_14460 [Burkholderiaceae bacterium]